MHPLQNGSQVIERPAKKPTSGFPGYFTESGDNNIPSYPGQDWFNDVIDEFLNALSSQGVTFLPNKTDHLAKALANAVTSGQESLIDGSIYKGSNGVYVQDGDTVPAGITHLSILVNDTPTILVAWDTLTLPANVTSVPVSDNGFSGYDVVTDQGTFEFLTIEKAMLRRSGFVSGWGAAPLTECTIQIQSCIDYSALNNIKVLIDGHYYIDPTISTIGNDEATVHIHGLITRDNSYITFLPGAILESIPTSVERYCVLLIESDGATIVNPLIVGDVDTHIGSTGEWGYGIRFDFNSKNCTVINPKVIKCWGDSYVVVSNFGKNSLIKPYGAYSRRQGLSVIRTGPNGLNVHDYHFEYISGTAPQAGIDFEPDNPDEQLIVTLSGGGRCNNNAGYDLDFFFAKQAPTSKPHKIIFNGHHDMWQWVRFNSVANIDVKNEIYFDSLKVGSSPTFSGRIVLEDSCRGSTVTIGTLDTDAPPLFRLTPRDEVAVTDIARLKIGKMILSDESVVTSLFSLTNPSELSKFTFSRNDLVDIGEVISSPTYNMGGMTSIDLNPMPVKVNKINSSQEIPGTVFSLPLSTWQAKDINITRTANLSLAVEVGDILLGITKVFKGIEPGYTTAFTPGSGVTINGATAAIVISHPFKAKLSCDVTGANYELEVIYEA
ncbi:TPA: hypothetical protein NJ875_000663 [Vibrio parahaemolyticus]|nr:hypothetical protein [Vibrio parahaemolyticus]